MANKQSMQQKFEKVLGAGGNIASDPMAQVLWTFSDGLDQLAISIGKYNKWVTANGIKCPGGTFVQVEKDQMIMVSVQTSGPLPQQVTVEVSLKALRSQGVAAVVGAVNAEIKAGIRPKGDKLSIKEMPTAGFLFVVDRASVYK